jgi:hypothetical protein
MLRSMPRPTFQMNHTRARPTPTQMMVPNTALELRSRDAR